MTVLFLSFVTGLILGLLARANVKWLSQNRGRATRNAHDRLLFTSTLIAREQLRQGRLKELEAQLNSIALVGFTGWTGSDHSSLLAAQHDMTAITYPGDELVRASFDEFRQYAVGDKRI
jgi:hypothetical protein